MRKLSLLLSAIALTVASSAFAEWPEKPIKLIVPFKAGGTSDQTGRAFQAAIKENDVLSQPVTIINVGGHYSIGSRRVMEADPDGYEFLLIHIALMGGEGSGVNDFGYKDFEAVAATGEFCLAPMVRKEWEMPHVPNLTGTEAAYVPAGSLRRAAPVKRSDYEAWQPE